MHVKKAFTFISYPQFYSADKISVMSLKNFHPLMESGVVVFSLYAFHNKRSVFSLNIVTDILKLFL